LSVFNLNGLELKRQIITKSKTLIDISTLQCGVYIVKIQTNKTVFVGKVLKK